MQKHHRRERPVASRQPQPAGDRHRLATRCVAGQELLGSQGERGDAQRLRPCAVAAPVFRAARKARQAEEAAVCNPVRPRGARTPRGRA
jgi:hypothetical protein